MYYPRIQVRFYRWKVANAILHVFGFPMRPVRLWPLHLTVMGASREIDHLIMGPRPAEVVFSGAGIETIVMAPA